MEQEIASIKHKIQNEIDWVRAEAQRAIDAILNDESLSDEEKERRIAEIRAKADRDVMQLQMKMKKLIADQYMSAHNLDEEISGLNALIERAKLIAGADTPEAKAWVQAMMREVKGRLDTPRRRFTNEYSLVQMRTNSSAVQAKTQLEQIEHQVALMEKGGGKAHAGQSQQARAAAFLQAGEELSCMETERQSQQDQWSDALD